MYYSLLFLKLRKIKFFKNEFYIYVLWRYPEGGMDIP